MNTAEIIKVLSQKQSKTQVETRAIIEKTIDTLVESMVTEERFTIPGFGTFGARLKAARNAFNPALKEIVVLPAVKTCFFHPSSNLKEQVKNRGVVE
ncbi:MAG: HU family DNA-binding protein [Candidatus Neomarinimicrobiota bacterium]